MSDATHAIVVTVTFKADMQGAADNMLQTQVVPGAKAASGFIAGYWMHSADGRHGTSVELFDSQANAEAALATRSIDMPPEAPVTIDSAEVVSIVAQA